MLLGWLSLDLQNPTLHKWEYWTIGPGAENSRGRFFVHRDLIGFYFPDKCLP